MEQMSIEWVSNLVSEANVCHRQTAAVQPNEFCGCQSHLPHSSVGCTCRITIAMSHAATGSPGSCDVKNSVNVFAFILTSSTKMLGTLLVLVSYPRFETSALRMCRKARPEGERLRRVHATARHAPRFAHHLNR